MKAAAVDLQSSRGGRWIGLAVLVLLVQTGLVYWLSDRRPAQVRTPAPAPVLQIAGQGSRELQTLLDPTLFALPHVQSFSGLAWMKAPQLEYRPFEYREEPRWFRLDASKLGSALTIFHGTADPGPTLMSRPQPQPYIPAQETSILPAKSTWVIDGPLASRRLLNPFVLPSWPHTDLLTNTVIQAIVQPNGTLFSPSLLVSSGLKTADDAAMRLVREARFESAPGSASMEAIPTSLHDLVWGQITFNWHTVPAQPATSPP